MNVKISDQMSDSLKVGADMKAIVGLLLVGVLIIGGGMVLFSLWNLDSRAKW